MCIIVDRDYKSQKTALSRTKKEPRAKIVSFILSGEALNQLFVRLVSRV